MAQSDRNPQRDNKPRGSEPNFNWRGVILIAIAFALIGLAVVFRGGPYANVEDVPLPKFFELLDNKQIDKNALTLVVPEGQATQSLVGIYYKQPGQPVKFRTTVYLALTKNLQDKLEAAGIQATVKPDSNIIGTTILGFLPIAVFLFILYLLFRQQIRVAGKGALNFGKSKARMLARDKNKITFRDVAGVEEAKDEVQELVEFLRDPKEIPEAWRPNPKGRVARRTPGHRQNAAGSRDRRRSRCPVLLNQRL